MLGIVKVFNDVNFQINKDGGYLPIPDFNALSERAELKVLELICDDDATSPIPNIQKIADRKSDFIVPYTANVGDGFMDRPDDYYQFDELFRINGKKKDCEGEKYVPNQPIELLDSSKFSYRATTFIKELKPINKPIAKQIKVKGKSKFEFLPKDIGSVQLSYVRYPVFGSIVSKKDELYNNEVPDEAKSKDYEWDEWSRDLLIYYIVDFFSNRTREQALKQFNSASHQTVRQNG